jgi:hypothetical protein
MAGERRFIPGVFKDGKFIADGDMKVPEEPVPEILMPALDEPSSTPVDPAAWQPVSDDAWALIDNLEPDKPEKKD